VASHAGGDTPWFLLLPVAGVAAAVACHVLVSRTARRRNDWGHLWRGVVCGWSVVALGTVAARSHAGPAEIAVALVLNTISYFGLAYAYAETVAATHTSLRIRVLRECGADPRGLAPEQLAERYDVRRLVDMRLDRYLADGFLVAEADGYRVGHPGVARMGRAYRLVHRLLFGTPLTPALALAAGARPEAGGDPPAAAAEPGGASGDDSITAVVAARDEEAGLAHAVAILAEALRTHFPRYEILVYDDGSQDRTGAIADELAATLPNVVAIHHAEPRGLGGVIRAGLERAGMRYFFWMDGKGATRASALDAIFAARGRTDLVIPYPTNQHERSFTRRTLSALFQALLNAAFGLRVRYYNHLVLSQTAQARRYRSPSGSHAAQAEMLVRMLRAGLTYVEVPVEDNFHFHWRHTKAFLPRNLSGVPTVLARLFWDVHVRRVLVPEAAAAARTEDSVTA